MGNRELVIDASASGHEQMRQQIKNLHTENVYKVTLANCDRFGRPSLLSCFTCGFFGDGSFENYAFQAFDALIANPHIEELELSSKCLHRMSQSNGDTFLLPLHLLRRMRGLKTLVLDNSNWAPSFFQRLQEFLIHAECNIETLKLLKELQPEEINRLEQTFCDASSLRYYYGSAQRQLQMVLDSRVREEYELILDYEEIQLDEEELNRASNA